jgi:hypothetical protein
VAPPAWGSAGIGYRGAMIRRAAMVAMLVAACSGKKPAPAVGDDAAVGIARDAAVAAAPLDAGTRPARMEVPRKDLEAFLARWLAAQNDGDFDAYQALYAPAFRGVRRSGTQVVRMDRARWLADRRRMFGKPMTVRADDVEIVVAPRGGQIRFTQEWSSGRYHDVGPKVLALELAGGHLALLREEMLASKLVRISDSTAQAGPDVAVVHEQMIVLTDAPDLAWATGAPRLDAGRVPERDPTCDTDPPDYETDSGRYWDCAASDPERAYAKFVASQAVDPSRLPPALAAWEGAAVHLGGGKKGPCDAVVDGFRLRAERETVIGEVTDKGDALIAEAVLASGRPVLVATVVGGCDAGWARRTSATRPVAGTIAPAPPALVEAARPTFEALPGYIAVMEEGRNAGTPSYRLIESGGRRLLLAVVRGAISCSESGGADALYTIAGTAEAPTVTMIWDGSDGIWVDDVIDADGDGWPEIVTADGFVRRGADGYQQVLAFDFPLEIAPSYCDD